MVFIKAKVYADDDDFQWTDDEAENDEYPSSSSDEDELLKSPTRLDEANIDLIEDKEVRSIVETTNQREKQIFTGKGKKFAYPTEWKSDAGCGKVRLKIHRVVDGLAVRIFAMLLVLVDVAMVLVSVTKGNTTANAVVSIVIVTYFLIELLLRLFAWGKTFFKDWLEVFDGVVVLVAFVVTVVIEAIRFTSDKEIKWAKIVVVLRFVRFFLYLRILFHTATSIYMALRYKATQSKKRYVLEGYDLDLTYITSNVIAMSFPSSGAGEIQHFPITKVDLELAIRNPREEVARFFNEKYPDGHYKIYNLCKERGYPIDIFNGQVARYKISDHNVPKMSELLEFCQDVGKYMNEDKDNVIAVHCKGGKGRTGCCIAAWLLYSGQFKTAKAALDYFGGRRMDVAKGVKFQGVETPSQKRYVKYLEMMMSRMGGKMPPVKELIVKTLEIRGLDEDVYADLRMEIVVDGVVKYPKIKLVATGVKQKKKIQMAFVDEMRVAGDVKFRFKSRILGKDYDNCAFFFWIHTTFVEKNKFEANRYNIGNANKPKHNDKYNEQFYVKMTFVDPLKRPSKKQKDGTTGSSNDGVKSASVKSGTVVGVDVKEDGEAVGIALEPASHASSVDAVATPAGGGENGNVVIHIEPAVPACTKTADPDNMVIIDGKPDYPVCTKTADPENILIIDEKGDTLITVEHPDVQSTSVGADGIEYTSATTPAANIEAGNAAVGPVAIVESISVEYGGNTDTTTTVEPAHVVEGCVSIDIGSVDA